MNKSCQYEEKARSQAAPDKELEMHVLSCADCRETRKVSLWIQKFAAQAHASPNLRTPGFLLLKARLIEKQSAASRAVQPIVWMQIASLLIFILGIVWLEIKSGTPVFAALTGAFASLLSAAPIFLFGSIIAALICLAFAYKIRAAKN